MFLWNLLFEKAIEKYINTVNTGLNPCFCGTYFLRFTMTSMNWWNSRLNPCFCGTYFLSHLKTSNWGNISVLILVFVELTFWVGESKTFKFFDLVLILVFVELTFWGCSVNIHREKKRCVLILVFVELTFWVLREITKKSPLKLS